MKAVDYYVQVVADTYKNPSVTSLVLKGESSSASFSTHHNNMIKCHAASSSIFGPTRNKLLALILILILAFWSMFTGSLTLNLSTAATNDFIDYPLHTDLDILEVEAREKMVRHMWDVYTHSKTIKLPTFWQRAFEAAYEDLISDVSSVRNIAVLEIAKMSMVSLNIIFESLPQPTAASETDRRTAKETGPSKLQKSRRRLLHVRELYYNTIL
ncbi:putative polyol transporter 6 [Heracleum sosnowskyi]|uniref:Polyol transporter 6 n=1 Tax=Heracleum sosnowskyi TaxID=360622 RepID=A0AAD8JN90_9APIA|nr:putative polyol transporter 6 [Heracleum sosnowskyi]